MSRREGEGEHKKKNTPLVYFIIPVDNGKHSRGIPKIYEIRLDGTEISERLLLVLTASTSRISFPTGFLVSRPTDRESERERGEERAGV